VPEGAAYYYPNRLARYLLTATADVMGRTGLKLLLDSVNLDHYAIDLPADDLKREFSFESMAAFHIALEDSYGTRGGRGMALRIGRAAFSLGFKHFGVMAGMSHQAFRALPLEERTRLGLEGLAHIFNHFSDQHTLVEATADSFQVIVNPSPMAWGRKSDRPVCHSLAGIIQECVRWASNGREFGVVETACQACGAGACIFNVSKSPLA
jgi:predicted hydrocarbon binding protein